MSPISDNARGRSKVVYARWRITAALVLIGLFMLGALAIAARSHTRAVQAAAVARQQRHDTLAAERAVSAFWHEREAMAEWLALGLAAVIWFTARPWRLPTRAWV